jgi:LacI family transcriptional regulator
MGYLDGQEGRPHNLAEALSWKPDGFLIVTRPGSVKDFLAHPEIPCVIIDRHHESPPGSSRVEIDDRAIGRRAAEYFLKQRFTHLAVVISPDHPLHSVHRQQGFTEALAEQGLHPSVFQAKHFAGKPWFHNPEMNDWLEALPKPVGIYGVKDAIAQRVQEQCQELNLHIPSEVSVLGTGNHPLLCEMFRPFLSSVPVPLEAAGFRAAALLDELMDHKAAGRPLPVICDSIPPGLVVERQSTTLRAIPDPAIARAAEYLHDQALKGGTITEAARIAGINRRSLERKFKQHLGSTPGEYLNEVKTDHAKRLLTETELHMSEIAEACGMVQDHFSTFFKKSTGITPSAYRRTHKQTVGIFPGPHGPGNR